ncbi:MAG TPA: Rne/Rng family ribonuclease [Bryobacteraceae bacterium]|nr:Rne/Rng family ribonuclease [Bryobacteraceae bacterium]
MISSNRHETKVAILEDDQLVEIYFQRANEYSLAGSIHKGRVTRVLPGMQSAFVDIGLERDAFLYVSDFFEDNEEYDKIASAAEEKVLKAERIAERGPERAAESVPERSVEPVAVEPAPAAPEAAAARPVEMPPAAQPRSEEEDRGERRGRRSRRRRQRGRGGFPEAKYASLREEQEPAPAAEPAAPRDAETEPVREASAEFSVLPGESLAKYSRPEAEEEPAAESAAVEQDLTGAEPVLEVASVPEPDAEPEALVEEPAPEPEPAAEVVAEAEPETEPETAGEPEPVAEAVAVPEPETEAAEAEQLAEAPDAEEEVPAGLEEAEEGEPAAASEGEAVEPSAEPIVVAQDVPSGQEIEPARMPVSLTATLREQGYRYMHRVSRRARRKMRNAGPAGAGEEREAVAEAAPEPRANGRGAVRTEPARGEKDRSERERPAGPSISELLKEGQEVLVQIAKEPLGQKGARITSHIALPGRFVVYMPTVEHLGVSRKIASDEERLRLKRILHAHRTGIPGGFIVRTAGEGKSEDEIASDMRFLFNMWLDIRQKAEARKAPALIHHDLDVVNRILRDQMTDMFKTVWVDNEEIYESVLRFIERFQPGMVSRVKLYTRSTPIFDSFNISTELEKALRPKVWLKSGGYIVINQTEALVAVDVNTGKFVGKSNRLEDTIVKTNTEAVKEIVRQIRLRDLGGIIVVDFIDMDERKNRQKVMQALEDAMRADKAPNKILQFNDFGLVAITRKRVKQSLERTLCSPCPYCESAGYVKSVQTVIGEILQEAYKISKVVEGEDVSLRVNPEVAKVLKASNNDYLEELEEVLGRPVIVQSDPLLQQEKFDLI